jgi:hypothetical protein
MFGYLCVVMKHSIVVIAMQNFQRDPFFSARVSPCSDAWRTLIHYFDPRGVGRAVGLLTKLIDAQGETKSIDAFLQLMLDIFQDINETSSWLVKR